MKFSFDFMPCSVIVQILILVSLSGLEIARVRGSKYSFENFIIII